MNNEWDFFANVQQQLAQGKQLVTGYFLSQLVLPLDEQRGPLIDEGGHEYELGEDFRAALTKYIRKNDISWGILFDERLICFGPAVNDFAIGKKHSLPAQGVVTD